MRHVNLDQWTKGSDEVGTERVPFRFPGSYLDLECDLKRYVDDYTGVKREGEEGRGARGWEGGVGDPECQIVVV